MPRNKTHKRGRLISLRVVAILLAGGISYVIDGVNTTALRTADVSPAETVALRFPDHWGNGAVQIAPAALTSAMNARAADTASDAQLALLNPEPMIPQAVSQADPLLAADAVAPAPVQTAALELPGSAAPVVNGAALQRPVAARAPGETKAAAAAAPHRRVVNRPGYMLDDAQIASIKERLRLTPDQEEMWPAVEAALRNMTYTHAQEARAHGAPAANEQAAAVDPNAVQGLKSAAVPLILSFNAEQKEEVRNIAHVMGLDQLASQF
jgi:hypothetical protein